MASILKPHKCRQASRGVLFIFWHKSCFLKTYDFENDCCRESTIVVRRAYHTAVRLGNVLLQKYFVLSPRYIPKFSCHLGNVLLSGTSHVFWKRSTLRMSVAVRPEKYIFQKKFVQGDTFAYAWGDWWVLRFVILRDTSKSKFFFGRARGTQKTHFCEACSHVPNLSIIVKLSLSGSSTCKISKHTVSRRALFSIFRSPPPSTHPPTHTHTPMKVNEGTSEAILHQTHLWPRTWWN